MVFVSYKISATTVIGEGAISGVVIGTAGQEPGRIETLKILQESATSVAFGWEPSAIDAAGLAITGYNVSHDDADFVFDTNSSVAAGASTFTYAVTAGNEGKTYRFRIAAINELGQGNFSDEIRLVATDPPGAPTLTLRESTRTLTSMELAFGPPGSAGGAPLTGYHLYRDEGFSGSPFTLLWNGTGHPEIISYNVTGL